MAALRFPAAPALILPRLSPAIPTLIDVNRWARDSAEIAAGLLAEGILQESDWTGKLGESLVKGLSRWLAEQGADLRHLPLALSFTDTVEHWSLEASAYHQAIPDADPERDVGGLALRLPTYTIGSVHVGERVQALEGIHSGAGYSVLGLVETALWRTVTAASPSWALDQLERHEEWMDYQEPDSEADPDEQRLTREVFHEEVPLQACSMKWDSKPVKSALRKRPPGVLGDILRAAEDLAALLTQVPEGHRSEFERGACDWCDSIPPLLLRWSQDDIIPQLFDDYAEIAQQGNWTDVNWIYAFQVSRPETIREAARALKQVIAILVRVDRLLELLDTPTLEKTFAEEERVRVRV